MYSSANEVIFGVVDVSGNELTVGLVIRLDTVDVYCLGRNRAVFDRDALRAWLANPRGVLTSDDVSWAWARGRIGIAIDPLASWCQLSPLVSIELAGRI